MATASQLLPVPAGPMPKVMTLLADGVDVALLARGLGAHRAALGAAQDLGGEHLGRALVGLDHVDACGARAAASSALALLEQHDQLLEQAADLLGLAARRR